MNNKEHAKPASHARRSFTFEIRGVEEANAIMVKNLHQQITKWHEE